MPPEWWRIWKGANIDRIVAGLQIDLMPRVWPDPRDNKPDRKIWLWFVALTLIGAHLANLWLLVR